MKASLNMQRKLPLAALVLLAVTTTAGCIPGEPTSSAAAETERPEGWTTETHSNEVDPNYDVVFPQGTVNQIRITVSPEDWEAMQANLSELLGPAGSGGQGRRPAVPGVVPDQGGIVPGQQPQQPGAGPVAPGIPGWVGIASENPAWVPATVEFNGLTWTDVGLRFKGNSSLRSAWSSGSTKLPLKLDFDEFEDEFPETENQRFYGFKQLSFSNAFMDPTYMRDVLASDILEDAGLPVAETAWYQVVIDYGDGPVDLGLYVAIEVVDDTVIERCFGDDSGNIYEADGPGATLAGNTYDRLTDSFLKENNEDEADWSDVEALYAALHSETRATDPTAWRADMESVFNVDGFLQWLAVGALIQHWDTYGQMSHNFYLYDDPDTGQLNWISWDHNQVLAGGSGAVGPMRAGGMARTVSLGKDETGEDWPLVRYLLDDPIYEERYLEYIEEAIDSSFDPQALEQTCRAYAKLIAPYAVSESGEASFESSVQKLIDRIYEQHQVAVGFLAAKAGK